MSKYFISKPKRSKIKKRAEQKRKQHLKKVSRMVRLKAKTFLINKARKEIFYASEEWKTLKRWAYQSYVAICFKCCSRNCELHIDHVVPITAEPMLSTTFSNLQILCKSCNEQKSNKEIKRYKKVKRYESAEIPEKEIQEMEGMWIKFFPPKAKNVKIEKLNPVLPKSLNIEPGNKKTFHKNKEQKNKLVAKVIRIKKENIDTEREKRKQRGIFKKLHFRE
jgi:5-methylcytosine-specific restriction endonuclease McrA